MNVTLVKSVDNGDASEFHCVPQVVLLSAALVGGVSRCPLKGATQCGQVPRQDGGLSKLSSHSSWLIKNVACNLCQPFSPGQFPNEPSIFI